MSSQIENALYLKKNAPVGLPAPGALGLFVDASGNVKSINETGAVAAISGGGSAALALARAQALAPSAAFDTVVGSDCETLTWFSQANTGGSTTTQSTTDKGGVILTTAAAAAGLWAQVTPSGSGSLIDNASTSPWYLYARIQLQNGVTGTDLIAVNMIKTAPATSWATSVGIGAFAAVSTTNFSWRVLNASAVVVASGVSTTALDLAWHTVEIVSDGTTVSFILDGAVIGTTPATNVSAVPMMSDIIASTPSGAQRAIKTDKLFFVCVGN